MKIGVDIGGTFMDFCAFDAKTQQVHSLKILTTPQDPGRELQDGLTLLKTRYDVAPEDIDAFVHGTTVGINTIIQRKGSTLALVTNTGFEDVIELARLRMPEMYSLFCARPEQLISRDRVFGVAGRINAQGREIEALDVAALPKIVQKARATGAEGVIVCFLHSYRNPAHEVTAKSVIEALAPDLFVFTSAEIWPVIREYERSTTAILNGYVHPRIAGYLDSLEQTLARNKVPARPLLTKSNGGVMNVAAGKTNCVSMLLSGTASGVIGASFVAKQAGVGNVLTLDIGGTSADLALIIDGLPQFGTGEVIGDFPLYVPSVSVTSIGAGGGSIAWVDAVGVLKVGPESAGSTPGPACYGRGGNKPTVTDAMAVCGFIGQAPIAFDQINVDRDRARAVIASLAETLGRNIEETASAIIDVAVSEMFVEVNKLIARYGVDERDFTLMAFGGAGPMLGGFLANEVGISQILIPHRPGVVSALGGLVADLKGDFIETVFQALDPAILPGLQDAAAKLRHDADAWLRDDQGYGGIADLQFSADMRYQGQSHEIEVLIDEAWIGSGRIADLAGNFHARHRKLYGFSDADAEVELINLRLVILGATRHPDLNNAPRIDVHPEPERDINVWLDGKEQLVPLYDRATLGYGQCFDGPAILHQDDTTTCIPDGHRVRVDARLNLILTAAGPKA